MGQRGEGGLSESWASVGKREEREKVGQAGPKKEMGCGKKRNLAMWLDAHVCVHVV